MSNKVEIVYILTNKVIDLLKKKRAALISSAITDKIDVMEIV
jgi:hypothetical protein